MARMFPSQFPRRDEPGRWAEGQVFDAFGNLDDSWLIFYSVAWQSKRFGRQGDGEADFILVHPRHGIFTVEVKGGSAIEIIDGEWFTTSRGSRHKLNQSPFAQAVDSKMALRRYLSTKVDGFSETAPMGHFVVFPSHRQEGGLGPDGTRAIICDKDDLANPRQTIARVVDHWDIRTDFDDERIAQIRKALAPTVRLGRSLRDRVADISDGLTRLTEGQIAAMAILRHHRQQLIIGSAGTGKTVLATARARQLSEDGFRTLLICYNRPLGLLLEKELASVDGVTAGSFHSAGSTGRRNASVSRQHQLSLTEGDGDGKAVHR